MKRLDGFLIFMITLRLGGCPQARAEPIVEVSGATGFGALVAGVTSGRFAISPSASFSVRNERWFFVARDTVSFLGATGGRFGINNETTLGSGRFWDEAQRKTCAEGAYAAYKSCHENCQEALEALESQCRKRCAEQAEVCEAGCRKLPEDDKDARRQCWEGCNNARAACIKKCKK